MSTPIITNDFAPVDGLVPESRRARTKNPYTPVMLAVSIAATIGILAYAWFLLNPANRGDLLPWAMVIVAEVILIFHALMAMWAILAGAKDPRTFAFHDAQRALYDPAVNERLGVTDDPTQWPLHLDGDAVTADLLITVYGEPIDVIRRTAEAAKAVRGAHQTWILDDGKSDAVRDLAAGLRIGYIRRLTNHGAKAGNVNNALTVAKGDYFVILDADFVPRPEFLEETLPFMVDSNVAFVQTPQTYGNMHNIISRGAGYMQSMFYRFIQPGRTQFNAAFCVGTNVLFRRSAVLDIGGMYTQSKSEDVWTSLMLHERGWKSIFIPKTLAVGDAPETIEAYTKQQQRWATGGFEILFTHNPFNPKRKLTLDQRFMYFVTATFYLTGIAPGILLFVPALEVFFDLHPVNLQVDVFTWFLFYAGFYVLQILLAALTLGTFRWEVLLLAANSFPIYLRAFKNAFIGVDTKWHVTGTTMKSSAFNFIIPQVLTFVFLLGVSIVSIWRDINLGQLNVATFWSVVNTLAIGAFIGVGFHEAREVQGVADPTDVDLAERVVEDEPSAPLGPDEIVKARRQVQLLASAPAEVATDLLESSAAAVAIDAAATEPVPAESTPKRAAGTAGIN
jgi:cellulose synthase (UDP-forming)